MNENRYSELLAKVIDIVYESGEIVKEAATRGKRIKYKGRIDLVTETDVEVEEFLKHKLAAVLPDSGFLAEETAKHTTLNQSTWIIDPVDGTTNFAHGLPMVATSVALWQNGKIVLGVINLPLLGELFSGMAGGGACMNGDPISVTQESNLEKSLLATGFPYAIDKHLDTVLLHLKKLLPLTQGIRRPGAAALDLAYVACGRYDGFYESALNPWDTAAGILLVHEAGGRVSEYDGTTSYQFGADSILATNGAIHDELSEILCSA